MSESELIVLSLLAGYWVLLQVLLYFSAFFIFLSGIDDLFIDVCYWLRKATGCWKKGDSQTAELLNEKENPIALMIPAWQEHMVIAQMLTATIKRFQYSEYKIFVGTYPNDPKTQAMVDNISEKYPQVIKVITNSPGPSTKADCLNDVIESIFEYETHHKMRFNIIAYHDAEDVVHPLELKLFNTRIPQYDMVQIPILPLPKQWYHFTGGTYIDEFTEYQAKDVVAREALTGNVCSAGVGTAFSRKAIMTLYSLNHGHVFDDSSLTEDYEMSYRLHEKGLKQHFELYPTPNESMPYLAARAYFPFKISKAIRQKSRWMIGIIFQGWHHIGWPVRKPMMCYFLLRDRKGIISNLVNLIAYFIALNVVVEMTGLYFFPDGWHLPSLIPYGSFIWDLLLLNGIIFLNRIVHRFYFIVRCYNLTQAFLSIPRLFLSNIINFCAYIRALSQMKSHSKHKRSVSWDKTDHEFPDM